MKYGVGINGYTAEVSIPEAQGHDSEYVQDVFRMYAAFAAQHLSAAPELQDELSRRVISFSRRIAKEFGSCSIDLESTVNSSASCMKYDVEIEGYTAQVRLHAAHNYSPSHVQDVACLYAGLAAQHLGIAPEFQDELTIEVIAFSRRIVKEVKSGRMARDAMVNSSIGMQQSAN